MSFWTEVLAIVVGLIVKDFVDVLGSEKIVRRLLLTRTGWTVIFNRAFGFAVCEADLRYLRGG